MNAKEKEALYDEKIAPELWKLAKLCHDNGLSFVAGVEYDYGEIGRTCALEKDASELMRRANLDLQSDRASFLAITVTKP